jgi:hypothetical protein
MLVHSRLALHRSREWIQQINEKWAAGLNVSVLGDLAEIKVDPLLHLLIQGVLKNNSEIQALEAEIHATLLDGDGGYSQPEPDIFSASIALRGLYRQRDGLSSELSKQQQVASKHAQDLKSLKHQLNEVGAVRVNQLSTIEANNLAIADLQTRLQAQHQLLAASAETHLAELQENAASTEKIKHDLEQESELLLLQLHQVQEELEQHFLQGQDLKTQLVTAEKNQLAVATENSNLKSALDAEAKAKTEALMKRDAEAKSKTEALKQRDAEAKAKTEALTQRDAEAKAKTEALTQRDAEAKAKAEALTQRDAEAKAKAEALTQRDAEAKGKSEAQKKTDAEAKVAQEFKQESELLLLQLHQVQEELENYFLQHQQASQDNKKLDARWKKLLLRYPDYVEWEHIEVIQKSAKKGKKPLLQCQIRGLNAGARHVDQLDLCVAVVGSLPILMLMPPALTAVSPLMYWPSSETDTISTDADSAKLLQVLILDPAAVPDSEAGKLLRSLTQSDLQMVRVACAALIEGLPSTLPQRHLWVQYLNIIRQQLEDLPQCWRFDSVALKNQQVNPDYEHLWFALSNVYFGARHWPSFEFRLGAANIKRGKFSQHPKLEFPQQESGAAQFENWFEESEDDRGPKFELRFDTSKKALDLNTWKALSSTDQAQLLSMSKQLPELLQRLQKSGTTISRPWSEWQNMVVDIQQAFQHSLSAPVLQLAKA